MKTYIYFLFIFFIFVGCSSKQVTIRSLQPSQLPDYKVNNVKINDFIYDDITQKELIMQKLTTKVVEGKNVFILNDNINAVDTIINGDVVENSLLVNRYFDTYVDYSKCMYYKYDEKNKKRECIEYRIKHIPCVTNYFNVKTNISVTDKKSGQIVFNKLYSKSYTDDKCYRYDYGHRSFFDRPDKFEVNSDLAEDIAEEFVRDIGPHYIYLKIDIIDKLDDSNLKFTKDIEKKFENIVNLMDKNQIDIAQKLLLELDSYFNNQSAEVIYNLGLIEEYNNNLVKANKYYEKAQSLTTNIDYLELIQNGILRTKRNLENKIKAKSQLP